MKIANKLKDKKYSFILQNLTSDKQLEDNHKQEFIDYSASEDLKPGISDVDFERKVNDDFFYRNISPLVNKKHNKVAKLKNNKLLRIMSKSNLYKRLKNSAESKHPHLFFSEDDFIDSLEFGAGELVDRFGFKNMKAELEDFEFGYKMMWSNYSEKVDKNGLDPNLDKRKLACILGLDNITIKNPKYLIIHEYSSDKFYPTTFDAGFNELWQLGGKTKPRRFYAEFGCSEMDCERCMGLIEFVHKPNTVGNITHIEILD